MKNMTFPGTLEEFDELDAIIMHTDTNPKGQYWIRKDKAMRIMTLFVKQLLDEGKLLIAPGHGKYFDGLIEEAETLLAKKNN